MTESADITREQIEHLLRFYAEAGLDFALEPEPVDRFAANAAEAAAPAPPPGPGAPTARPDRDAPAEAARAPSAPARIPDDRAVAMASEAAAGAADLDVLKAAVEGFEACNLKRSARHTVFEGGARGAPLMLVGGAPSRDDDKTGEAMSGLDGIMLGKMLAAIGLDLRADAYCGFCVPWAVPGGEAPTPMHLKICAPFLRRQIALARPRLVVALGNVAARQMLGSAEPITRLRGRWTEAEFGGGPVAVTALFSPSFLRTEPRFKRMAWLDLLALKKRLTQGPANA